MGEFVFMVSSPAPIRLVAVIVCSKGIGQYLSNHSCFSHRFNTRFWSLNHAHGFDWYTSQPIINPSTRKPIEISALDFDAWSAPANLHRYFPKLKVGIVLEDPAIALYRNYPEQARQWEGMDIHDLSHEQQELLPWDYVRWLKHWLKYFPAKNMCVVSPQDLSPLSERFGMEFAKSCLASEDRQFELDHSRLRLHLGVVANRISWL